MSSQYRYFMVTYFTKPGGQIDESVSYSRRVKASDIASQNIIMDFVDKKIIKCVVEGKKLDTDWDRLVEYFRRVYPVLIAQLEEASKPASAVDVQNT